MCGILALFGEDVETPSYLLNHRGPDDYSSKRMGKCRMDFYRLAINDLTSGGMQPFVRKKQMLVCNGEIYNHREFRTHGEFVGNSDCEVLIPLIESFGILGALKQINGDYAFVYTNGERVLAARDHVGVRPLFYTMLCGGCLAFAAE